MNDMHWIDLAQDRNKYGERTLMNTVMSFRAPENVGKFFRS
jgi:hypothetical protein